MIEVNMPDQEAKKDAGKPEIRLVPMQFVIDVAKIRSYGNKKYKSPDNWKTVEWERYWDAMMRHLIAAQESDDPLHALDKESGLPHLSHAMCNAAFLAEFAAGKVKRVDTNKELKIEPGKRAETSCYDEWFVDFEDKNSDKSEWMEYDAWRPFDSGLYEFNFTDRDEYSLEGYYVREFDYVVDKNGMRFHPRYWRSIK